MLKLQLSLPTWHQVAMRPPQSAAFKIDFTQKEKEWDENKYNPKERIWDLKTHIRVRTYEWQKHRPWHGPIPLHLFKVSPPPSAQAMLPLVNKTMNQLFCQLLDANHTLDDFLHSKKNFIKNYKDRGLTYWPTNSTKEYEQHGKAIAMHDFRHFLQNSPYKVIDEFFAIYLSMIVNEFASRFHKSTEEVMEHIQTNGTLYILKYAPSYGLWMHIDNILRSDATVYTIGVGRDITYDVAQVIPDSSEKKIPMLRSKNEEGTMMILDGKARYMYAHGIPYGRKTKCKYTIIMRLFHDDELTTNVGYCPQLKTEMYTMYPDI